MRQIGACKLPECFGKRRVADFGLQELREPLELRAIFGSIITLNQKAQSFRFFFQPEGNLRRAAGKQRRADFVNNPAHFLPGLRMSLLHGSSFERLRSASMIGSSSTQTNPAAKPLL